MTLEDRIERLERRLKPPTPPEMTPDQRFKAALLEVSEQMSGEELMAVGADELRAREMLAAGASEEEVARACPARTRMLAAVIAYLGEQEARN